MAAWTIIELPVRGIFVASKRREKIIAWALGNDMDHNTVGVSMSKVRFKNSKDATFFQLSFRA